MASRNFYVQLILRIILLTATALAGAFGVAWGRYPLAAFFFVALGIQLYALIAFIDRTNRKLAYFFDAIHNEDFTLRFPESVSIGSFKQLNRSLNRVNGLIQEVHMQLQLKEQYYQEILKQASIGIMTYNEKGHILFANPTLEKLLDHSPLNHIKQLRTVDQGLFAVFSGFRPFDRKLFQLANEREQVQLALKSTPLTLGGQSLLLVVVQDIHRELDEKETESWIRLIRVLTHEIMNTITPIASISDSIIKYYKDKDRIVPLAELGEVQLANTLKGLEVIKEQGGNLMDFVQSYRSLLQVPEPDRVPVRGLELLQKIEVLMSVQRPMGTTFAIDCTPRDLEFFIDEKQILQVLINMVKNALQAVDGRADGRVQILAGMDSEGTKYIEVLDNGPGIPPERMEEIFVPFFTTKNDGNGIGLSLSKRVLQMHGGNIQVRSFPDNETVFRLNFA